MTPPDHRQHRRFAVDLEASVWCREHLISARTRDLSRSGICLVTPEEVAPGSEFGVDLVLSFGDNAFSEPLRLKAKVVWCTAIFGSYQVGAMFVDLNDEQAQFLEIFLRFLDGTLTPEGMDPADDPDDDTDESPDKKDDPFRS